MIEINQEKELWWKPAIEIFSKVSTWVVVPIVLALIIGKWFDGHYGTKPWIFLGLTLVAFMISSFGIVQTIFTYLQELKREEEKQNDRNEYNSK